MTPGRLDGLCYYERLVNSMSLTAFSRKFSSKLNKYPFWSELGKKIVKKNSNITVSQRIISVILQAQEVQFESGEKKKKICFLSSSLLKIFPENGILFSSHL